MLFQEHEVCGKYCTPQRNYEFMNTAPYSLVI